MQTEDQVRALAGELLSVLTLLRFVADEVDDLAWIKARAGERVAAILAVVDGVEGGGAGEGVGCRDGGGTRRAAVGHRRP